MRPVAAASSASAVRPAVTRGLGLATGLPRILLVAAILSSCAARNPVEHVPAADVRCPDLTGTYCANGQQYTSGGDEVTSTHLAWFLPLGDQDTAAASEIWNADRVGLTGGHDGELEIGLAKSGAPVFAIRLDATAFRCGIDTLLVENGGRMWGGVGPVMLPIVGGGWSDENTLFWKGADGSLRARKARRNSGMVMAIPVSIDETFAARFRSADQGCD